MSLTQVTTGGVDENINIDSNTLKVDGTNNRVGVGESSPDRLLHLKAASSTAYSGGSDTADYNFLKIENTTDDKSAGVYFQIGSNGEAAITATEVADGATDIAFQNRGGGVRSEKMRLTSDGKLGVGTDNPGALLDVKASSSRQIRVATESSNSAGLVQCTESAGNNRDIALGGQNVTFCTGAFDATSRSEAGRFDTNGRLLVGTTSAIEPNNENFAVVSGGNTQISLARNDTSVTAGNTLAQIKVYGNDDNGTYQECARIGFEADGTHQTNDKSTRMVFETTAGGASSPTEHMRITQSGTIGMGTDEPMTDARLTLAGVNDVALGFKRSGSGKFDSAINADEGALIFKGGVNSNLVSGLNELMRIRSNGDVGIGNAGPFGGEVANRQHLTLNGANSVKLQLGVGGTERGYLYTGGSNLSLINTQNGYIRFNTNDTERIRLLAHGSLRVSTARTDSDYAENNTSYWHAFHHHQNNQATAVFEHSGNHNPYGLIVDFSDSHPDDNSHYFMSCIDQQTIRMRIYSDGDLDNHDNSYGAISDVKLKQDIVDAGSQWDDIKNLRVRKFKFKSDVADYGDEAKTLIGVVAQETELVSPGLVKESPDVDKYNNDLGTTTKSVRYSVLYMKAIKALQEAMDRIETLEAKVAALEAAA